MNIKLPKLIVAIYLFYAVFEVLAGYTLLLTPLNELNVQFPDLALPETGLHFVRGFGAAIFSLGIISVCAIFSESLKALRGINLGFALYNAYAAYNSFYTSTSPEVLLPYVFVHGGFAIVFFVLLIASGRQSKN